MLPPKVISGRFKVLGAVDPTWPLICSCRPIEVLGLDPFPGWIQSLLMFQNISDAPAKSNDLRRDPSHDGVRGDALRHECSSGHNRPTPNRHSMQDDRPRSHPNIIFDNHSLIVLRALFGIAHVHHEPPKIARRVVAAAN